MQAVRILGGIFQGAVEKEYCILYRLGIVSEERNGCRGGVNWPHNHPGGTREQKAWPLANEKALASWPNRTNEFSNTAWI